MCRKQKIKGCLIKGLFYKDVKQDKLIRVHYSFL